MYEQVLQRLGLSKNEARIYEALLTYGVCSVGTIAAKSRVHRRNVYDSLKRLLNRSLVYEIPGRQETTYQAIAPNALQAALDRKKQLLKSALPELEKLHRGIAHHQEVYVYRGAEGWKNYMRDMLRVGEDAYFIGASGGWMDDRVKNFFPYFSEQAERKKLRFYHLFDYEVKDRFPQILAHVGEDYKFLPQGYSAPGAIDIFGDYVNLLPTVRLGYLGSEIRFTVIVNKQLAEAFRIWFRFMWDICPRE